MSEALSGNEPIFPGIDEASFYEELSNEATVVVVNEDETRTVDLKVQGSSGG